MQFPEVYGFNLQPIIYHDTIHDRHALCVPGISSGNVAVGEILGSTSLVL